LSITLSTLKPPRDLRNSIFRRKFPAVRPRIFNVHEFALFALQALTIKMRHAKICVFTFAVRVVLALFSS
jgi:hypothetical protein